MPPAPKPTGPAIGGKRLPLWAWAAAAGAGLLIGLLLLRGRTPEPEDVAGSNEALDSGEGGGGSVVSPLDADLLQGLGLTPPDDSGGGSFFFGDEGGSDPSFDLTTYQGIRDYEDYYGELPPGTYRRDPGGSPPQPDPDPGPAPPPAPLPPPGSTPPPRSGGPPGAE